MRDPLPDAAYVALVTSSSGAIGAKIAAFFIIPAQAAVAAAAMGDVPLAVIAALTFAVGVPRGLLLIRWHRVRRTVRTTADARRWEVRLALASLPFSLGVGLMAAAAILRGDPNWAMVEIAIGIGYCAVFPVSVGMRASVGTAHMLLAIVPGVLACLWMGSLPHLVMAAMAAIMLQVLRANMLIVSRAFTERFVLQHEADLRAQQDPLTSLPNRRAFDERIATAGTRGEPLSLILIDLDGFKDVNDTFGHKTGDALLVEIAARMRACVTEDAIVARLGGDEFGILASPDRAEVIADEVIAACRTPFLHAGAEVRIGASAGIAVGRGEDMHQAADFALYDAKRDGRNCWRRAPVRRAA